MTVLKQWCLQQDADVARYANGSNGRVSHLKHVLHSQLQGHLQIMRSNAMRLQGCMRIHKKTDM